MVNTDLSRYAPTFSIKIGGKSQQELEKAVISISVDESIEKMSMFNISLNEGLDRKTQTFKWLDNKILDPSRGQEVEIYVGYANSKEKSKEPTIIGVINSLEPSFPSSGIPSLKVSGYDHSFRLQRPTARDKKTFDNENDFSDIVRKITKKYKLGVGDIDSIFKPPETTAPDNESSDYKFLDHLAKDVGYEFFVRGKKLYFRKPRDQSKETRSLRWGREIISFNPTMNTAKMVSKVTVRGHNPSDPSKPIIGVATSKYKGNAELEITNLNVSSVEEAKALAKGRLNRVNNSFIEGTCECIGIPDIRAGTNIRIEGVSKRFSGKYYIKSVTHSIGDGGYTLSLSMRGGDVGTI